MSADSYSVCPRCKKAALKEYEDLQRQLHEGYGVLPLAEFDELRARAEKPFEIEESVREYYEFHLDPDESVLHISYHGKCDNCALEIKVSEAHPVWSPTQGD